MPDARPIDRLIFVFNADAGKWSAFVDSARKVLRLDGCTLCAITHGLAGEKDEWKECKTEIGVPVDYVHRDEIDERLANVVGQALPCVVAESGGELVRLLEPDVLDRCQGSVSDLRGRLIYYAGVKGLSLGE